MPEVTVVGLTTISVEETSVHIVVVSGGKVVYISIVVGTTTV